MGAPGVIDLIRKGVITGKRKTINRGKAIFTGMDGCKADEIAWAADNPLIELHDSIQVLNISRTISPTKHDLHQQRSLHRSDGPNKLGDRVRLPALQRHRRPARVPYRLRNVQGWQGHYPSTFPGRRWCSLPHRRQPRRRRRHHHPPHLRRHRNHRVRRRPALGKSSENAPRS